MTRLSIFHCIPILLTAVLLSSCSSLKSPELATVEIADLSRNAGEGTLVVNLAYRNPNNKTVTIKKLDVEGMINQKALGTFKIPSGRTLGKLAEDTIAVEYAFDPDEIYPGFMSRQFGAIGSKRVRITLNGEAEFTLDGKSVIVPLEYSEVYKIPD